MGKTILQTADEDFAFTATNPDDFDDFGGVDVIQKPRWVKLVFY